MHAMTHKKKKKRNPLKIIASFFHFVFSSIGPHLNKFCIERIVGKFFHLAFIHFSFPDLNQQTLRFLKIN